MDIYTDIIIIGGGAAGFFAAINIAIKNPDLSVAILERGKVGLQKVKISGGGRCNVTHAEFIPADLDDLDDLDGAVFAEIDGTGPLDATGTTIIGMDDWEQRVQVQCVDPFDVTNVVPDGSSEVVRISVTVMCGTEEIARLTWIAPR